AGTRQRGADAIARRQAGRRSGAAAVKEPAKSPPSGQEEVVAFLAGGAGSGAPARRIDTHISMVFLAAVRVLKIKRAIKLPFLDNSTLEKRRLCCEEELAVNARHAPQIY